MNTVSDTAATDAEADQPYEVGNAISAPGHARSSHRASAAPTRTPHVPPPVPPARVAGGVAGGGASYLTNGSAFRHAPEVGYQGVDVMNVVGCGLSGGLVLWLTMGAAFVIAA